MAYIAPNSIIKILKDAPLDDTYNHTLIFSTASDQYTYFASLSKYTLTAQSYQRVQRNVIRVEIPSDNLYDCNYVIFQNTSFGSKWFYAFITSVEYINNAVSEITFEIDVMQTWHFAYTLRACFVEREHSVADPIGGHLVPENLEIGQLRATSKTDFDLSTMYVCAMTSKASDGSSPTGRTINGVYTPLNVIAGIPATDATSLNQLLEDFVGEGQEDAIVSLYQYPAFCGDASTTTPQTAPATIAFPHTTVSGYTPKNNKLFTYPYCCLIVSNNQGQTAEFRWEDFELNNGNAQFTIAGVFAGTPCVMCYPRNHKGIVNDYDSGLTISSFPMCPFSGDAYQAWMAQNRSSITTSIVGSAVQGVASGASIAPMIGAAIGGLYPPAAIATAVGLTAGSVGVSVLGNVLSAVGKTQDLQNTPPQVHGQTSCDSLNVGLGRVGFTFKAMQIKTEFAIIVDNFFTMFGYATNKVKVPNRSSRPHWNFVKTAGCVITGSVPSQDANKICSIYDNGITFWKNGSEVGDYTLDNSPSGI